MYRARVLQGKGIEEVGFTGRHSITQPMTLKPSLSERSIGVAISHGLWDGHQRNAPTGDVGASVVDANGHHFAASYTPLRR
jgi:hypothetical protein